MIRLWFLGAFFLAWLGGAPGVIVGVLTGSITLGVLAQFGAWAIWCALELGLRPRR